MRTHASRRGRRDERGAILVLSTAGIVLAIIAASLAVDLGFLAHEVRVDQKVADLAALDAVRELPASNADLTLAAQASAARNGFPTEPGYTVSAVEGIKAASGSDACVAQPGSGTVCVTATSLHKNFFPFTTDGQSKTRVAVAGSLPEAAFSVGSTLAAVDTQKSFLDPILGNMLGGATALNMSAVSYSGLAGGNVSLRALQTQLLAMGYDVGTVDKLLATDVSVANLLRATGQALTAGGQTAAAAEINAIPIASIPSARTIKLGQLVSLSQPGSNSALDAAINAFGLVTGAAGVANGNSFVDVPGITVNVPGVATVGFKLRMIQPAQTAKGPVGVFANTSQVELQLNIALLTGVTLDLNFVAASAKGTLTAIDCDASPSITIAVTTAGATVTGAGNVPLLGTLSATGTLAAGAGGSLTFAYPAEFAPAVGTDGDGQRVSAATLDLSPATITVTGTGAAGATAALVQGLLPTILTAVDLLATPTLQPVVRALGLDVAAADVLALDMYDPPPSCGTPRLIK